MATIVGERMDNYFLLCPIGTQTAGGSTPGPSQFVFNVANKANAIWLFVILGGV
jgi:hypothetical protein